MRHRVCAFRPPPAGGAGPHRENWPEVGVPVPAAPSCRGAPCDPGWRTIRLGGVPRFARLRRAAGKDPEFGVVRLSAGTSAFSVIRAAARYTPFAALRAAVPAPTELARGRRSLASGALWTVGVPARGCICAATGQRSAFPCLRGGPGRDRWPELHFACGGLTAELRASKPSSGLPSTTKTSASLPTSRVLSLSSMPRIRASSRVAAIAVSCMLLFANV